MEVGWLAGPSLFTLLLCQVMRLWRCASETGWRWVGAARVPAVWGGGVNCYFLLKLDFIFVHSETSTLSWNTVLALNFHPTMQELGVMYRCVPEMEKTVSDGIKKRTRARLWRKIETVRYRWRERDGGLTRWQHTYFSISSTQWQMSWTRSLMIDCTCREGV